MITPGMNLDLNANFQDDRSNGLGANPGQTDRQTDKQTLAAYYIDAKQEIKLCHLTQIQSISLRYTLKAQRAHSVYFLFTLWMKCASKMMRTRTPCFPVSLQGRCAEKKRQVT